MKPQHTGMRGDSNDSFRHVNSRALAVRKTLWGCELRMVLIAATKMERVAAESIGDSVFHDVFERIGRSPNTMLTIRKFFANFFTLNPLQFVLRSPNSSPCASARAHTRFAAVDLRPIAVAA
jgi:hypothetical protein